MDRTKLKRIFATYAGLCIAAGAWLFFTTTPWLLFTGAALIALGCTVSVFAQVDDPKIRRRAFLMLATGSYAANLAVVSAPKQLLDHSASQFINLGSWVSAWLMWLAYYWSSPNLDRERRFRLTTLFGNPEKPSPEWHSVYEEQIRQAACQEERNRLARDLHDSIKQQIFSIHTTAAAAEARFDSDPAGAKSAINDVRTSAREAMVEMEAMIDQMSAVPLEVTGMQGALKRQCEALGFRTGANVQLRVSELPPNQAFPAGAQQALFRIAQEALANIARHARATEISVELHQNGNSICLKVIDNGRGFRSEGNSSGMGLQNIRTRAAEYNGTVELITAPGEGTTILVSLPLLAEVSKRERSNLEMASISLFCAVWVIFEWKESLPTAVFIAVGWGVYIAIATTSRVVSRKRKARATV